jgi:hypothetical protein
LAVVQKTKTMKKDSAFKLKSGNKPSISKMMGISPVKKAPSKAELARKLGYSEKAENLLKAVPNKAAYDKLSPQDKIAFDKAAKRAGLPTKKSPASKKKFRGARSAAAGQTAGQIIKRERLMI